MLIAKSWLWYDRLSLIHPITDAGTAGHTAQALQYRYITQKYNQLQHNQKNEKQYNKYNPYRKFTGII